MSEVKCSDLLVSKADVEELNSQLAHKNSDLLSEIEQLKVFCCLCCVALTCFKLYTIQMTTFFGHC